MVHVNYIEIVLSALICLVNMTTSLKCHKCNEYWYKDNEDRGTRGELYYESKCKKLNDLGSTETCNGDDVCYEYTQTRFHHGVAENSKMKKGRFCGPKQPSGCTVEDGLTSNLDVVSIKYFVFDMVFIFIYRVSYPFVDNFGLNFLFFKT